MKSRARVLSYVLATLGFAIPVAFYFWLIDHYALNILHADQWNDIQLLSASYSGHLGLSTLWGLHYENRIFFPNLVVLLLAKTTHYNVLVEEYLSAVLLFVSAALVIAAHRRRTGVPPLSLLWYCPVAVLMLSIAQFQNTLWGFQLAWYLVLLALTGTVFILDRAELRWWSLGAAMVVAVVGSYSSLQGLLIWAAGLVLLYVRRRPIRYHIAWIGAACATTALYFYHYVAPAGANGEAIRHPVSSIEFFLVAVGDVAGAPIGRIDTAGLAVLLLGLAITLTAVWALIAYCRRRVVSGGSPVGAALICFGLLFAALVTAGRIDLGLVGASQSRYVTFDILTVVGLYLIVLDRVVAEPRTANRSEEHQVQPSADAGVRARASAPERTTLAEGRRVHRGGAVTLLAVVVAAEVCLVVGVGVPEGLSGARVDHLAQIRAARVSVNIDKYPNTFVNFALSEFLSASFLHRMDHVAMAHHLSLYATNDAAQYRAEGLIVDRSNISTAISLPLNGSVLSGPRFLSAVASEYFGVSRVEFEVSGHGLHDAVISKAQAYPYGWLGYWRTTEVPNGVYALQSVAFTAAGRSARSAPVHVTVDNS